ncbi:hypothetical protein [Herbaspirillum sp. GW103]|uniref:hypothetical protein n=1 Tax=Herbaspirillum sp. GW103 TaxID=1175306 RepID=UPI00054EE96F|nr:hypothetical protein [Herbaspirillum sp. GW103]
MDTTKVNEVGVKILHEIYKAEGQITSYALFRKMKIAISELMKALLDLTSRGYIRQDGEKLILLQEGIRVLFNVRRTSEGGSIPEKMIRKVSLNRDSFYIPSLSRMDRAVVGRRKI